MYLHNVAKFSFSCTMLFFFSFYAREGTSGALLKSHRPSVSPSVTNRVSAIAHTLLKQN